MDDRRGHVYDGEDCVDKGRVPIAGFIGLVRTGFLDGFLDANLQQLLESPAVEHPVVYMYDTEDVC